MKNSDGQEEGQGKKKQIPSGSLKATRLIEGGVWQASRQKDGRTYFSYMWLKITR